MITCEKCGRANEDHFRFCLGCGANLDEQRSRAQAPAAAPAAACSACGAPLSPGQRFCGVCGTRADAPAAPAAAPAPVAPPAPAAAPVAVPMPVAPAPVHVPPAAAPPAAPGGGGAGPQVGTLTMLRPDGTPGDVYPLRAGENNIGRATPADVFARDPHLSPLHATFVVDGGSVRVIDRESLNGVYYRISEPTQLGNGDFVRVGQELLRFEFTNESEPVVADDGTGTVAAGTARRGAWGRLERISAPAEASFSFVLRNPEHVIGRERGDILFRDDGYVSGMHARVYAQDGRVFLEDMGSSNGTFVRIRGERTLPSGGLILMGQQPFRIQLG